MDKKVIENKEFINSDKCIIFDINNEHALDNYVFDSIYLQDGLIISTNDYSYKHLYNDLEHPLVMEEESFGKTLYINPEYYLNNQEKIDTILSNYLKNYKEKKLSIDCAGLIKDKFIDIICDNKNIKEVSLAEYSNDPYTLTKEVYNKFKNSNIRVGTKYVTDELKDNYDDIIKANSEKYLIGYFKYRDLISKKGIFLERELTEEELDNLKFINPDLMITLNIDNFEHINVVNNKLKELGKKNNIKIKLDSKIKFNDYIFNNNINDINIYVETPELQNVSLSDYLRFEKLLYEMIKNTNNLSPFEKYIYAYNITKQFKEYKENENNKSDSRKLYSLLVNEYMVCVGYSRLFGDLLDKMGIENQDLSINVDVSYDDVNSMETEFKENKVVERAGHARRYVHIVDSKYNIDGYYVSDPTWDNDLEHDYYNNLAMTDNETTLGNRYIFMNLMDIFNINNIDEYIEKLNKIRSKFHYNKFLGEFKRIIDVIKSIDINTFSKLNEKYDFIDKDTSYWPDSITDLVYDLGNNIVNKVNKTISSETIFDAVKVIYKNSYGYTEELLDDKLEQVKKDNIERQSKMFPTRYRINKDGSTEVIMNEENKFEIGMKK